TPCYLPSGSNCRTIQSGTCDMSQANYEDKGVKQSQTFTAGGVDGISYDLTFTVNGIVEPKYYVGGTRDAGDADPPNLNDPMGIDAFYRGGSPNAVSNGYNVYKMVVRDSGGAEVDHYYLNSLPR